MKQFDEYWNEVVSVLWDVEEWDNKKIKAIAKCAYEAGQKDGRGDYLELIYAVETKHPDETRHQTALRYIQQAENRPCEVASAENIQ